MLADLQQDSPERIPSLLYAATHFVQHTMRPGVTYITDAFFPGYAYLIGHHAPAQVEGFTRDLYHILAPFHPLIIYLQCDIAIALQRAVAQRGVAWLDTIA